MGMDCAEFVCCNVDLESIFLWSSTCSNTLQEVAAVVTKYLVDGCRAARELQGGW